MRDLTRAILEVLESGGRGAIATVVRSSGSTPQRPGARLLLRPDGTTLGTVGGGAVEESVLEALRRARDSGKSEFLTRDLGYDLGMCCGGRMEIFVEPISAAPRLLLFGAGHVGKPLAAVAHSIGFDVTIIDERAELNTPERFPNCTRIVLDPVEFLKRTELGDNDWVVIATHEHPLDESVLDHATRKQPRYIGLVGSRRKVYRLIDRVEQKRGEALDLERIYAPVGLDLGALGPEEIAVSVAAELVALRRGRAAPHLTARAEIRARNRAEVSAD